MSTSPADLPAKISCRHVWKIFGPNPQSIQKELAAGLNRSAILEQTGHVVAVRDVSFDVRPGEIFVVMGLSGSGKSTLIRCLTRLIEPTQGEILIDQQDVVKMSREQLRELRRHKMSMVFQKFALFPHRRVLDNVAYGLEIRGMSKEERHKQAAVVLDMVGLADWTHHYPHELSGGMQQRVGLARALAVNPEVLLCDEPFSALDPLIRRDMQNELLRLQEQLHKTIVFITHDFSEAVKLGSKIAIMKDGAVVQIGTPEQIVARPADDYVREFTKDIPRTKVLTAATIMLPLPQTITGNGATISLQTTLEQLISLVAEEDRTLGVVNEQGEVVGLVNRQAVLRAMTENGLEG